MHASGAAVRFRSSSIRSRAGSDDAQIGSGDHVSLLVLDKPLRLDRDSAHDMQDAKQRLAGRLRSMIGKA